MFDPSREHQAAHGQIDHGLGDFGSPLAAAIETAIASQPAKGAFDHPAAGQDNKLGRRVRTFDNVQDAAEGALRPGDQRSRITAVGPDALNASIDRQRFFEEQARSVAILDVGWQHHDHQQQAHGIDQNVALDAVDLFARVVAAHAAALAGFDGLAVDDASTGLALAVVDQTNLVAQVGMDAFQQPRLGPPPKIAVNTLPRGQVLGQIAPLAARAQKVEDGIEQFAVIVLA